MSLCRSAYPGTIVLNFDDTAIEVLPVIDLGYPKLILNVRNLELKAFASAVLSPLLAQTLGSYLQTWAQGQGAGK